MLVTQLRPTICHPMDLSPPGSSVIITLEETKLKGQYFMKPITYFWVPIDTCLFLLFVEEKRVCICEGEWGFCFFKIFNLTLSSWVNANCHRVLFLIVPCPSPESSKLNRSESESQWFWESCLTPESLFICKMGKTTWPSRAVVKITQNKAHKNPNGAWAYLGELAFCCPPFISSLLLSFPSLSLNLFYLSISGCTMQHSGS